MPRIPTPCGAHGSVYLDWPQEESVLIDKALEMLYDANLGAKLWKIY